MRSILIVAATLFMLPAIASAATAGLVKGSGTAVYWVGQDGKRYVFPTEATYASWFPDFSGVRTIADASLAAIPLGGNATYRPGVRLLKLQTDPKVYAVGRDGTLRWIETEAIAAALYGSDWATKVDDLPDAFFVNYAVGAPIAAASAFAPTAETAATATIDEDKGLAVPVVAPVATSTPQTTSSTPPAATSTPPETPAPSFGITRPADAPSGIVSPSSEQTVGAFTITNGPGGFSMVLKGLTLTLSSTISNTAPRTIRVYRDAVNAGTLVASGTPCAAPVTVCPFAPMTFDDASFADTDVSGGTSRTFLVTADTSDATTGDTFTMSVPQNGVLWSDGVTSAITEFDGLPLSGNTLRY